MYIIIAILIFGILIAIHEFGHFMTAKLCGVRVLEFSIGMGPALLKKQGKETLYSLRLLPIGGYCAMEGEDSDSDDPRAFTNQNRLKKILILVAGAGMNCLLGLVLIIVVFSCASVQIPEITSIPAVPFTQVKEMVAEKYNRKIRNPFDLEPEEEELIGRYFKEEYDADFVFVTHYPSKKRPFYAMDDPADPTFTLSFDLLYHGLEITTGGQRIHDYNMLLEKIEKRGMTTEGMEQYMDTFKHGMPPHGGLGIGLERLTMKLIGEDNVRETTLFPRDMSRLEP